jgi:hypothetical protein
LELFHQFQCSPHLQKLQSLPFTSLTKFCLMGHGGWYADVTSQPSFANLKCIHNAHPPQNVAFGFL